MTTTNRQSKKLVYQHVCQLCGKEFQSKYKAAKFCSRACVHESQKGVLRHDDVRERLLKAIKLNGKPKSVNVLCKWAKCDYDTLKRRGITFNSILEEAGYKTSKTKSKFATDVYEYLCEIFGDVNVQQEYTFDGLRRKIKLRVDYFVTTYNLVVEADDSSHRSKDARQRDQLKNKFLQDNKINTLRIVNSKFLDISKALNDTRLYLDENPDMHFFNCWDGGKFLPISSQVYYRDRRRDKKVQRPDREVVGTKPTGSEMGSTPARSGGGEDMVRSAGKS